MTNQDDLRHLLAGAARLDGDGEVEATAAWEQGRRRRTSKRVGASVLAGVMGLAVVGIAWQTGLLGASSGQESGVAATFPASSVTFVFTPEDADVTPEELSGAMMSVPDVADLAGTTWELQQNLWRSELTIEEVIGTTAPTLLSVPEEGEGWAVVIDGCGEAAVQEALSLAPDGSFGAAGVGTTDIGCAQDVQEAEDFWMEVLPQGGTIHQLDGDQVLLLSIPGRGADDPVGVSEEPSEELGLEPTEAATTEPDDSAPAEPTEAATTEPDDSAPAEPTEAATTEPTDTQSADPPTAAPEDPTSSTEPEEEVNVPWTPAGEQTQSEGGLLAGGPLLAPDLRVGAHESYDRIVLDLTGAQSGADHPGWLAAYADGAVLGASGQPVQVAGDSLLQVVVSGMAYPEPGDPIYDEGPLRLETAELGVVVEAVRTLPFEAQLQVLIGLTGEPRPYRVLVLEDPMRLVIDVQR